ncbi:MAG TPA: pantoate--beta-alanine ligase [Dokdonella sp.]|uniref:pantoate--beta-alanine ligase n=1 Tax=Dokdonella sp. TaxID=2291710 RepID=UPI002D7E610E|nr:pantoate--beta-alanine ligase [Dokdonella sp.]HET9033432.1 pantoate--beta-alanine ligase [Dokdonella sp.]
MLITHDVDELRARVGEQRRKGRRVAFVPTMGNLHAGHYSLISTAREYGDFIVASIFVNPTQFGVNEDFSRYPRTPQEDALGLEKHHCDLLFTPEVDCVYPFGAEHGVRVSVPELGDVLEGAKRPGHFDGVASVVSRLFNLVQPDVAIFGSKDYQQLLVIRRLSADLGFPVEIVGAPIVRESSGLAMSSRNQYLDAGQREQAAEIRATLEWVSKQLDEVLAEEQRRKDMLAEIESSAMQRLVDAGFEPDYVAIRSAADLGPVSAEVDEALVILIAARLGSVRLIDNLEWSIPTMV